MAERPQTIDDLVAGHPLAERQLRALRAVEKHWRHFARWMLGTERTKAAELDAELDAADAAAKGGA